jgi:hypothetical protein
LIADGRDTKGKERVRNIETAWREVVAALKESTDEIEKRGSDVRANSILPISSPT